MQEKKNCEKHKKTNNMKKKILIVIISFCASSLSFAQSISYKHLYMIAAAPTLSETNDSIKRWNYKLIDSMEKDYLGDQSLIFGWGNYDNPTPNNSWAVINIQITGYFRFVTWNFSSKKAYQQIYGIVKTSREWEKENEKITNEGFELTYKNNKGSLIFLLENKDGWYKVTLSYFDVNKFNEDHPIPEDWDTDLLDK